MQQDAPHWWVQLGYPAFEPGDQGFPRPGQVLKHYRLLKRKADGKPWTQADLAQVLGVNVLAVSEMENKDVGLKDIHRLRQLANLFAIPPLLLGIVSLEEIQVLLDQENTPDEQALGSVGTAAPTRIVQKKGLLNLDDCKKTLKRFWALNHQSTAFQVVPQILKQVHTLYYALPLASGSDAGQIKALLCYFHILLSGILEDQQQFQQAANHAHRAIHLARNSEQKPLQAFSYYRRGELWFVQGKLSSAISDYEAAYAYKSSLDISLTGAIMLKLGVASARQAQGRMEKLRMLKHLIDPTEKMIRQADPENDLYFLKLNEQRYHLDKSATLLAMDWALEALDELTGIHPSPDQRRAAYHLLLSASAYAHERVRLYPIATELATEAFTRMSVISSHVNIVRIANVQKQLSLSPYGSNPEVARLGLQLNTFWNSRCREGKADTWKGTSHGLRNEII
jgi:transcriptional regulator with XRE-family HTH domain